MPVPHHTGRDAERLEEGLPGELQTRRLRVAVGDKKAERRVFVARPPQVHIRRPQRACGPSATSRGGNPRSTRAAAAWSPCSPTSMLTLKNTETKLSQAESAPPEARPPPDPPRTPHPAHEPKGKGPAVRIRWQDLVHDAVREETNEPISRRSDVDAFSARIPRVVAVPRRFAARRRRPHPTRAPADNKCT